MRRSLPLRLVLGLGLLAGLSAAGSVPSGMARAATSTPTWSIWKSGKNTFAGYYTNNTGQTATFVALGTSAKASDAITAFNWGGTQAAARRRSSKSGDTCSFYAAAGSVYCSVSIPAGGHVVFKGTTAQPVVQAIRHATATGAATDIQACDSNDGGTTNNCTDNPVAAKNPVVASWVQPALSAETKALQAVDSGRWATAKRLVKQSINDLHTANHLLGWAVTPVPGARSDLSGAEAADGRAISRIDEKSDSAAGWLRTAIADKERAIKALDAG